VKIFAYLCQIFMAYSKNSHQLALSLSPTEALAYLSGIHQVLIAWDQIPAPIWQMQANDRLLIHSLGFPDNAAEVALCVEIFQEFGFDVQTFPAFAIQGLVTVEEILLYDGDRFTIDAELHGCGDDLFAYQSCCSKENSLCYGIRFSDAFFLDEPIYDVLPPLGSDRFWTAQTQFHHDAFRSAICRDRFKDQLWFKY
jgi:hypothetical protein